MWTYSGDPTTSPLDEVRFLTQDVEIGDQQVSDEGINYFLVAKGESVPLAAVHVGERILMKYARLVNKTVGPFSLQARQKFENYERVLRGLRQAAGLPAEGGGGSGGRILPVPGVSAGGLDQPKVFGRNKW
jgi:hypothetical protein